MAARGTRHATCALALALALGPLGSQRGRASDALRVLVRVVSADDRALLTRLRGQLSDVNVQLIVLEDAALEASLEQQLSAAHALVERHASAAILWAAPGPAAPGPPPALHRTSRSG